MLRSVRQRLIASYLFVALATAVAVGAVALALVSAYNTRAEREYLRANAMRIAANTVPLLAPGAPPNAREQLDAAARFYSFLGQARVKIRAADETLLADSGSPALANSVAFYPPAAAQPNEAPPGQNQIPPQPEVNVVILPDPVPGQAGSPSAIPGAQQASVVQGPWGGFAFEDQPGAERPRSGETVRVPVLSPADRRVVGFIELADGPAYGTTVYQDVRSALLGGVLAGALLAVLAGLGMARQVTRPLERLGEAAGRMAAGDLGARAPALGDDEFGRLGTQFNRMAGQLEESFAALAADREALRRFVADAAHELRTPLTAAMTFVELVLNDADPARPRQSEFLEAGYAQLERLNHTVRQLLDLSLLDAGVARMVPVPADLRGLADRALLGLMPVAIERGLTLTSALPTGPLAARFDEHYLRQAVDNLLANALKFTPPGGVVTLGGEQAGNLVALWVADTGPGIPADALPRLFERFYRGRHNPAHIEGSGLGLAIAYSIVAAHGGTLRATSVLGEGARFTIELPGAGA